jgi:hypothetical protein
VLQIVGARPSGVERTSVVVRNVESLHDGRGFDVDVEGIAKIQFCDEGAPLFEEFPRGDIEAHGNFDVNLDVVWETVQTALPELLSKFHEVRQDAGQSS